MVREDSGRAGGGREWQEMSTFGKGCKACPSSTALYRPYCLKTQQPVDKRLRKCQSTIHAKPIRVRELLMTPLPSPLLSKAPLHRNSIYVMKKKMTHDKEKRRINKKKKNKKKQKKTNKKNKQTERDGQSVTTGHVESDVSLLLKTTRHLGPRQPKIQTKVLGHSLVRLLICSHRSLIRLLHTACFVRALCCAHLFSRLLTDSLPSSCHGKVSDSMLEQRAVLDNS